MTAGMGGPSSAAARLPGRTSTPWRALGRVDAAVLLPPLAAALVAAVVAARPSWLGDQAPFWATLAAAVVAVAWTCGVAYRRAGRSARLLLLTPLAVAAPTWLALFLVRPLQLYATPLEVTRGLAQLGFGLADLTRAAAIGAACCAAWCAGYLLALGRSEQAGVERAPRGPEPAPSVLIGVAALAVGTALWVALFVRQGGFGALSSSLASIRVGQQSSFYGQLGVWMVQGVALYALAARLREPSRQARTLLWLSVPIAIAAGVALQVRAITVSGLVAAALLYLGLRRPGGMRLAVGVGLIVPAALLLAFAQQVRDYSQSFPLREALSLSTRTPLSALYSSDLAEFDNLVAMRELVPASVPYLDGESLLDIPGALVPRAVWSGKPRPLDQRVSDYLYPGEPASSPISVAGELYWDGGLWVVLLGGAVLGALMGWIGRLGIRGFAAGARSPGRTGTVTFAVACSFTFVLLTRALGAMTADLAVALVGVLLVCGAMRWAARRP